MSISCGRTLHRETRPQEEQGSQPTGQIPGCLLCASPAHVLHGARCTAPARDRELDSLSLAHLFTYPYPLFTYPFSAWDVFRTIPVCVITTWAKNVSLSYLKEKGLGVN